MSKNSSIICQFILRYLNLAILAAKSHIFLKIYDTFFIFVTLFSDANQKQTEINCELCRNIIFRQDVTNKQGDFFEGSMTA
jgi:hypothetical protein